MSYHLVGVELIVSGWKASGAYDILETGSSALPSLDDNAHGISDAVNASSDVKKGWVNLMLNDEDGDDDEEFFEYEEDGDDSLNASDMIIEQTLFFQYTGNLFVIFRLTVENADLKNDVSLLIAKTNPHQFIFSRFNPHQINSRKCSYLGHSMKKKLTFVRKKNDYVSLIKFLYLPKMNYFLQMKNFLILAQKKQFLRMTKFLILLQKTNYFCKEPYLRCV